MNGDALSDLLLAAIALFVAWRLIGERPGVAIGIGLVGLAALLGVPDYVGIVQTRGPHNFASIIAACAGLPLIAISMCWPSDSIATRITAAGRFVVIVGGIGFLLAGVLGFSIWAQLLPAVSALLLVTAALKSKRPMTILGSSLLVCAFIMNVGGISIHPLNSVQQLHVLLAAALLLVGFGQSAVPSRG